MFVNVDYEKDTANKETQATRYDLLANIKHEGQPKKGAYSVHVQNKVHFYSFTILFYFIPLLFLESFLVC